MQALKGVRHDDWKSGITGATKTRLIPPSVILNIVDVHPTSVGHRRRELSANTPRYLIENHGPDQDVIKTAFAEAFKICTQSGISEITLLVPIKGQFPNTVVAKFLGVKVAKALSKGKLVKIANGFSMNLESLATFSPHKTYGMVIGLYLPQKGQNTLDSISSAQAIVLLPWTEEEGKAWLSVWDATVLGKSTWQVQQTTFPAGVNSALLRLTHGINLSTGLAHPSDKEAAKRVLSDIKQSGHRLAPDDIRKWAIRNNWAPKAAEDLGNLAKRYFK